MMTIQSDKVKAATILKEIKGCKVEDSGNSFWATFQTYTVVDVKCFNGKVDLIGLKDENNVEDSRSKCHQGDCRIPGKC